jgi:drug/metabolite transporter (DMT)-like permease
MIYLFLSICCSVVVSVLLKLARRYQIDVYQAITWNYSMAILLVLIFLKPHLQNLQPAPFYIYSLLGLLLPALFVVIAVSIRFSGIVRTEVAQRLSLFIPIIAAFLLFGEAITLLKLVGIVLGFAAIICSIPWKKDQAKKEKSPPNAWLYLVVLFVGTGIIDILFKQMSLSKAVSFPASLFMVYVIAFVFSLLGLFYLIATKKTKFSWPHIFFGWILGIANFGNTLFYLKAHRSLAKTPSVVFSGLNIGVIILGSVVGLLIFKEKLSLLNKAGIVLAIIAIIVISSANIF